MSRRVGVSRRSPSTRARLSVLSVAILCLSKAHQLTADGVVSGIDRYIEYHGLSICVFVNHYNVNSVSSNMIITAPMRNALKILGLPERRAHHSIVHPKHLLRLTALQSYPISILPRNDSTRHGHIPCMAHRVSQEANR